MNIENIAKANLHEFKGAIKQAWGKLTANDIERIEGKTETLIATLMKKYQLTEKEAIHEIKLFMRKHKGTERFNDIAILS